MVKGVDSSRIAYSQCVMCKHARFVDKVSYGKHMPLFKCGRESFCNGTNFFKSF